MIRKRHRWIWIYQWKNKKLVNSDIPAHAPSNLIWYKRDGLLTYIDQLR